MRRRSYYLVNSITFYRLVAVPVLIFLICTKQFGIFKWLLMISFFTDAIDGYLARRYNTISVVGALIDSIADDLTIGAAIAAMCVLNPGFLLQEKLPIIVLLILYLTENLLAFIRYRRMTSFHTYSAKTAAVAQGVFIMTFFFLPHPLLWLFYVTVFLTAADLLEEILLILMIPRYTTDVKSIYWFLKSRRAVTGRDL